MRLVRSLDELRWRRFIKGHPDSSIFCTPEMFEVFARTKGFRPTLWAAVDKGQGPLAHLLTVQITMRDGVLKHFTTSTDELYGRFIDFLVDKFRAQVIELRPEPLFAESTSSSNRNMPAPLFRLACRTYYATNKELGKRGTY